MAKAELGTKRTDPDTGKKFYDLNHDPVVSPYTGKSWPLSFFEENTAQIKMEQAEEEEIPEVDAENTDVEPTTSDSDDGDDAASGDDIPDDIGDDEVELEADDDDTFLEADEDDDDDDMSGIIGVTGDDDEV